MDIDDVLGKYPLLRVRRWVYQDEVRAEETDESGKDLGFVSITARELSTPSGSYAIKKFKQTPDGGLDIFVEGPPDEDKCLFLPSGGGKRTTHVILIPPHRGVFIEYKLDYQAREPAAPISKADYAALVVEAEVRDFSYLPEYRVRLTRVRPGERAVPLDYPENLGLRTKLGGDADFIQEQEAVVCKACGAKMAFVAQIDSLDHISKQTRKRSRGRSKDAAGGAPWMFQDVGMIYVFYCFGCGECHSFVQSY